MENKDKHVTTSKSSPWIECASKTRPGKKYLFNTVTGERKWSQQAPSPEKSSKAFKSPANDRLRRFQRDLQKAKPLNKNDEEKANTVKKPQKVPTISRKSIQTEVKTVLPSVLSKERLKILQTAVKEQLKNKTQEIIKVKAKVPLVAETRKQNTETEKLPKTGTKKRSVPERKSVEEGASLNKIQKFQKPTSIKPKYECFVKDYVIPRTSKPENIKNDLKKNFAKKRLLQHEKTQSTQKPETNVPELKFLTEIPNNNCSSLKRLKSSANNRLQRLRESLNSTENKPNNKIEQEAMDWEPTEELSTSWSTFVSPATHNNNIYEEPTDMEIDENLMLAAAGEKQEIKNLEAKWFKSSVYIVLDTNVFIQHLSFLEALKTNAIINGTGIILYIPYSVLQELDKLKLRADIKASVTRAIRFLNKMFEEKNELIQAQSALEERQHLIDVDSADDSILNCCLQVQARIPNVILLSEDVNLRNKAICNNISVSAKSDLLKKLS